MNKWRYSLISTGCPTITSHSAPPITTSPVLFLAGTKNIFFFLRPENCVSFQTLEPGLCLNWQEGSLVRQKVQRFSDSREESEPCLYENANKEQKVLAHLTEVHQLWLSLLPLLALRSFCVGPQPVVILHLSLSSDSFSLIPTICLSSLTTSMDLLFSPSLYLHPGGSKLNVHQQCVSKFSTVSALKC